MLKVGLRRAAPLAVVLGAAVALVARTASADCSGAEEAQPSARVSPGILFSTRLGRRSGFGLGIEGSYDRWIQSQSPTGYGAFVNGVYFFNDELWRVALGAQAHVGPGGVEGGWSYTSSSHSEPEFGAATGPYWGGFLSAGIIFIALRGTIPAVGDDTAQTMSIDLGLKAPVRVSGVAFVCHEGGQF